MVTIRRELPDDAERIAGVHVRAWQAGYAGIIPAEVLDRWLYIIIAVVIGLSVLPTAMHIYLRNREEVHARVRSGGRRGASPASQELATPEGPK
jgi:hypothetical protein